jgi:hypothetical protein
MPPSVQEATVTATTNASASTGKGDVLACIRRYESDTSGGYRAVSPAGQLGAYQFDLRTWLAFGGRGNPVDAPPAVQDAIALRTIAFDHGVKPFRWPTPSKFCG